MAAPENQVTSARTTPRTPNLGGSVLPDATESFRPPLTTRHPNNAEPFSGSVTLRALHRIDEIHGGGVDARDRVPNRLHAARINILDRCLERS